MRQAQHQNGHMQLQRRVHGPAVWKFRFRRDGKRFSLRVGTVADYPNEQTARLAIAHLVDALNCPATKGKIEELAASYGPQKKHRTHNCTPDSYSKMLLEQQGRCAICGRSGDEERLVVDHNHRTGKIRQLLCGRCNKGIGLLQDNPHVLRLAAFYLEKHMDAAKVVGFEPNMLL